MKALVERLANELFDLESYYERDITAIVQALESHIRQGEEETQAFSPNQVRSLLREATRDLRGPRQARQRWRRERLAVAALFGLAGRGRIRLTGKVRLTRPSRRCILDPLDADLCLPSVHKFWQQALVQRLAEGPKTLTDLAWEALGALLLFGGCWSNDAFERLWSLHRTDYDQTTGLITLTDPSTGDPWLRWYLHPVQQIALNRLIRARPTAVSLFPQLRSQPEAQFLGWFRELTTSTAPASIREITMSTARWMLTIFPPYLVALAGGQFRQPICHAPVSAASRPSRGVCVSEQERALRKNLRECVRRWLPRRFSDAAREDFLRHWDRLRQSLLSREYDISPGGSQESRLDNLRRLTTAVTELVATTDRGRTVLHLWDCGLMLIDRLGLWSVALVSSSDLRRCCAGLPPTTLRDIYQALIKIRAVAPAARSPISPQELGISLRAVRGRAPAYIPSEAAYEAIRQKARAGRRYSRDTLQTYSDLLALGLRKEEAIDLCLGHFDTEGWPEIMVSGTKSPAAHRRLPLWRHPNQDAAMRILAVVTTARENQQPSERHLLLDFNGRPFIRDRHPDSPTDTSVESLDHGLTTAVHRALLKLGVSPHALRHGSVSLGILQGLPLEWLSQFHGHAELRTTLEYYVHSAAERQRTLLEEALSVGMDAWVPLAKAPRLLGVTKQAVYRACRQRELIRTGTEIPTDALCARKTGAQYYIPASEVARFLRARALRGWHATQRG